MTPLFHAVAHGCHADKHLEVLSDIYIARILRGETAYVLKNLGAFGTNLALLAHSFEQFWSQPVSTMSAAEQSWLLNTTAFTLRALGRLSDAVEPMRVGAESYAHQKDWVGAAVAYGNLSELLLALGRMSEAIIAARQSVEYADRGDDSFWRMVVRTILADAQHQSASPTRQALAEANRLFAEAEVMQAEGDCTSPILYSLRGYKYCDILLESEGNTAEVLRRAGQALTIAKQNSWLLDIGLSHLTLGRGHPSGSGESRHHLDQAVAFLRLAGDLSYELRALLARGTDADLAEVLRIASRSGMRLHLTDYHLAMARRKAQEDPKLALDHLQKAETLIQETGYHRRDPEAATLRTQLAGGGHSAREPV